MHWFRFDTETNLIVPGRMAPEIVCIQYALDDNPDVSLVSHIEEDFLYDYDVAIRDDRVLMEAHNGAFDHAVIAAAEPDLIGPIFRMLAKKRGRDTMVLAKLKAIADGTLQRKPVPKFDLGTLTKRFCGKELSKGQDSWRTRYVTLKGLPARDYPEEARLYAHEDVIYLREVSKALRKTFDSPDEWLQVAAAFALHLAACWGVRTDPDALEALEAKLSAENNEAARILETAGFFRDGSVDTLSVRKAVEEACERLKVDVPRTPPSASFPNGQTQIDENAFDLVEKAASPALRTLIQYKRNEKNLSTYIRPMKGGIDYPMNSRPNVLVATGRTSWGGSDLELRNPWGPTDQKAQKVRVGTNLQNFPQLKGVRDCVVARPGHWLLSCDYASQELRTLGQECLWLVGRSTFADGFRKDPDWDPHSYMGGHLIQISYEEALKRKASGDKAFKELRKLGKALNFSLPGGVGPRKFVTMAEGYGVSLTFAQAKFYKKEWLDAFPEMRLYFEHMDYVANEEGRLVQFVSRRVRGDVGYTDGCNTLFQGLAADVSKRALFAVSMACYAEPSSPLYGCRILAFIHDELLLEVPIEVAHEAALETERLMNREFEEVCPDVPSRSEAALMTRWIKEAGPRWENNRLVAWDL